MVGLTTRIICGVDTRKNAVRFVSPDHETTDTSHEAEMEVEEVEEIEDDDEVEEAPSPAPALDVGVQDHCHGQQNPTPLHSSLPHNSPESYFSAPAQVSIALSPIQSIGRASSHAHSSPLLLNSASSITSPNYGLRSWPFQNQHEARLLHHYVVHLSLQVVLT